MSIYHCSIKIGSRSKGQSAVAAAAYRSGTKLTDAESNVVSDYTRKSGVVYSEVSLCKNAPSEYGDRGTLWNAVHKVEKAANAQLWREIEVALPQELNRQEQIGIVKKYVSNFVDSGMCADWSLHDKGDGNPHAHIMFTLRSIKEDGTWAAKSKEMYVDKDGNLTADKEMRVPDLDRNGEQKKRKDGKLMWKRQKVDYNDWNKQDKAEEWRALWAEICNKRLVSDKQIDHRSFDRQGSELIPTIHEGYAARQIERRGRVSERCEINREIRRSNSIIAQIAEKMREIAQKIRTIRNDMENENKRGAAFSERFRALFSGTNGAAATAVRGTAETNNAAATEKQPPSDTDRRIAELKREQEQQRLAAEAERKRERMRELNEAAEREQGRKKQSNSQSWDR